MKRNQFLKSCSILLLVAIMLTSTLMFSACGNKEEAITTEPSAEATKEANESKESKATEPAGPELKGTVKVQLIGGWSMESTTDPITGQKREGMQAVKDEFEKLYPDATLEFVIMGWDNYTQKTQAMMTVGECDVYQAPGIASFADQGLIEPLKPYIERDNFDLAKYIDGQIDGWKAMGPDSSELEIYGMPVLGDTRFIMYDTKVFDDWGVEYLSESPTLEELAEKAAKMTGTNPVTGEENYGIAWKGKDSADTIVNIAENNGGTWGEGFRLKELTFNFDSSEFISAAQWLLDMKAFAPQGVVTGQGIEKWGTPDNNIAMHIREYPMSLKKVENTPGLEGRYKIARLFVNKEENMGGMFAGSPFVIGTESKNKEMAWEFIKFSSSDYYQKFIFDNYDEVPCVKSALEWDEIKNSENLSLMLDTMKYLWTPRYPYRSAQPRYILVDAAERLLLEDATVEEAMMAAQEEAETWVNDLE